MAPPKIKSTDDFASRIEARSARANAPIGQVKIETKRVDNLVVFACRTLFWGRDWCASLMG